MKKAIKLLICGLIIFSGTASLSSQTIHRRIKAVAANDFLNSMGVCSSITSRGETLKGTIEALQYTGIRFIRCGLEDKISVNDMVFLHHQTGARICYGFLSGGTDLDRLIMEAGQLATAGALLAIEGNNEPNNWEITYQGETGGKNLSWLPVAKLQQDLYNLAKKDPVLKNYPIWNITESGAQTDNVGLQYLSIPKGAATLMPAGTHYADYANCHNYICHPSWPGLHDNQTWLSASPGKVCPVDGLYGNYGETWNKHFKGYSENELLNLPRVTTETGYAIDKVVNEETQARLYINLFLSQFKQGWSYTAIYLLRTRANEPEHESFALYKMNYSPKQAAHYLHNLTNILADNQSIKHPGALEYSILNQPSTVHDLLLQKNNGKFFLVIWGERFTGGSDQVKISFGNKCHSINIYDPTISVSPTATIKKTNLIEVTSTDHPLIIEVK